MASIITDIGMTKLASATPQDQLEITHIAVGDGGGPTPPALDPAATSLTNEVWRGSSSAPITSVNNPTTLTFEAFIPESDGGFTIREIAIFDSEGDMIAIGETPTVQKPAGGSDTALSLAARMNLTLTDEATVNLIYQENAFIDHQGLSNRSATGAHPASSITVNSFGSGPITIPNTDLATVINTILGSLKEPSTKPFIATAVDETNDAVLRRGAWGLGKYYAIANANTATRSGFYSLPLSLGAAGSPIPGESGSLLVINGGADADYISQIWIKSNDTSGSTLAFRCGSGSPSVVWQDWQFMWHSANLQVATELQAQAGISNSAFMTPLRVSDFVKSKNEMTGAIMPFATTVAPNGWIKANGAAVSRTTYADLFAKVGTFWGSGDGSTTFNVPDLRGEFVRAWDDGRGIDSPRSFGTFQQGSLLRMTIPSSGINHFYALSNADEGAFLDPSLDKESYQTSGVEYPGFEARVRPRNIALLYYIKY